MRYLGIYLGPSTIYLIETKDRRVINSIEMPQTIISAGDIEQEKVPPEIKLAESVAFLKNELARNNIEAKEATLCLSGKDMFVRSFEMPAMSGDELENAIKFEAEKYIPFKTENLISDYQVRFEKQSRTNLILFIGLKKEILDRYLSILSQLNIKVNNIEYSAFSVLRGIQMRGVNFKNTIGVLNLDLHGEDEINFLVLENGFPLFSRDISLASAPGEEGAASLEEKTRGVSEKLRTELQVSLDYYERKFPTKGLKKLILVGKPECRPEVELIAREMALPLQFVDLTKQIGGAFPYSLGTVKAFTAAVSKVVKAPLKINLLSAREKTVQIQERFDAGRESNFFEGVTVDARMIGIGAAACLIAYGIGTYQAQPVKEELARIQAARPQINAVSPAASYEEILSKDEEFQRKLRALNDLVKKQLYVIAPFDAIPKCLPKGAWLTSFSFNKDEMGFAELVLEGTVYLADGNKEFDAVYAMVSNLKGMQSFAQSFSSVAVSSVTRSELYTYPVTNFSISCKSFQEK